MKQTFCIIFISLLFNMQFINAQLMNKIPKAGKIGIAFSSFGDNGIHRLNEPEGSANYFNESFFTVGVSYIYPLRKWLEAETGVEYSNYKILIEPNLAPNQEALSRTEDLSLVSIPVGLRANFLKYFFVNGGVFLNVDGSLSSPIDNQSGIGCMLGLAVKYDFSNGISVFINPYSKIHSLLSFQFEQNRQRIFENGVRVGVTYNLSSKK